MTRLLQHYVSGHPTTSPMGGVLVRVDRSGIPLMIPGFLRIRIREREADVIRCVLTLSSLFRCMKSTPRLKIESIVDSFKGVTPRLPETEVSQIWERFFSKFKVTLREAKLLPSVSAGPNHRVALFSLIADGLAMRNSPELLEKLGILGGKIPNGTKIVDDLMNLDVQGLTTLQGQSCLPKTVRLGKLATKLEAAGKVRLFGITDGWTQAMLKPVHLAIMSILRRIPEDGTFDQIAPLNRLRDLTRGTRPWFSFDLSSATDRLPVEFQTQILSKLFDEEFATA
jgi:hypothetical protein